MESSTESWQRAVALLEECDGLLPLDGSGGIFEAKLAVSIFSAAITACERAAQGRAAINLYDLMSERVNLPRPDLITISSVVAACEVERDWAKLDTVLRGARVLPDLVLYHQLIRIAGSRLNPTAAFRYLQAAVKQGLKPTRGTYRELVEACQTSAETVPRGAYFLEQAKLLLNKSFPGSGDDSAGIGSSAGPNAEFMLDNIKHTTKNGAGGTYEQSTRRMLQTLSTRTDFLLHDHSALPESGQRISFRAAEELLAMHCEKQALSALLEAPTTTRNSDGQVDNTVRLAVSLCMCADCHMVFKYASEAYNRRIECDDPSRKHSFHRGQCSCLDNWPGKSRINRYKVVDIGTFD
jgi:DYW family of nucleic acid deaminases